MTWQLKLRKIGNSVGVVLPKETLTHLNVGEGDTITLTNGVDGTLRLQAHDPEVTRQLERAEEIMRRHRETLRELAK